MTNGRSKSDSFLFCSVYWNCRAECIGHKRDFFKCRSDSDVRTGRNKSLQFLLGLTVLKDDEQSAGKFSV